MTDMMNQPPIVENEPGHNVDHEIILGLLQGGPEWAASGQMVAPLTNHTTVATSLGSPGLEVTELGGIVIPPVAVAFDVAWSGYLVGQLNNTAVLDMYVDGVQYDRMSHTFALNSIPELKTRITLFEASADERVLSFWLWSALGSSVGVRTDGEVSPFFPFTIVPRLG